MPITIAAYDLANRSSEVTADVVARLGFIPDRVEKKLTVGQQRRGRRKKQSGRGGGTKLWQMYYKAGALRKYAVLKGLNPQSTKAAAVAALLQKAPVDVSHQDMYEQYTQGLLGDKDDVLKKLPGGQTYAVEKANWYADDSDAEGEPSPAPQPQPQPEDDSITYSQPPSNPAEGTPPADVSQTEVSTVNETALVRQATSSILEQSGFNSLDSIDSASDVDTLNESIDKVAAEPPAGVMGTLWNTLTNVAGRNTLQQVSQTEDVPQVARTQALRTGVRRQIALDLEGAADISSTHASTVNASIAAHEASHSQSQVPATPSQGDASSGVDLSTAAFGSFAESPVQQQLTSAIMDAVNQSQDARDATLLAPLQRTTNLIADTNRLLGTLNGRQLAAINRLGPELQTKLVTDRQLDRDEVPKVLKVLQDDPDIAELLRQGLVQPEQLKDPAYVASLRLNLLKNRSEGRPANLRGRVRASKAPVFKRQVESRRTPGLRYYKRARHVAPSIFAQ
eukprot:COSAG01_NODE_1616_length_9720_cov_16.818314_3_plen_508_part_00